ncbi:hypothetical protein ACIP98_18715 [Streptomyces sp. NPDC088354]|uniref:hypothetical protein n=1 Tax=Streptomyces sp. NPDC088354 TaxID=3365856 RepID=UPI00382A9CA3
MGPTESPDRATEVLGPDVAENVIGRYSMVRDYGLAEFHWTRASRGEPWEGHHVTLQVHRLAHRDRRLVNETLRARYGRFAPRLRFEKLRRLLERRGVPLVEIPEHTANAPYFRTFWQPRAQVGISVIGTHGEYSTPDRLRVGDVYKIHVPMTTREVEWRRTQVASGGAVAP